LLNSENYWQPLVALLDHVIAQGFAAPSLRDYVHVVGDVPALGAALRAALS
jgi:predicted Rossmann-fold nucleotide-binding protein